MRRRVRDILATNYIELLGIPPSAPARELRRYLQKAEMESEMGIGTLSHELIEAAKVELSTAEVALEYRVLARWGGDPQLAPWAGAHDRVLAEMRAPRVPPVEICRQWLQAHRDLALDEALGLAGEGGYEPLRWVGDVAEDYLSAVLVPGRRPVTASELAAIDFGGHRSARNSVWKKLIDCLRAEVQELREAIPNPEALTSWAANDAQLAGWYRGAEQLVDEAVAAQNALRHIERLQGEPLPADLVGVAADLGRETADLVLALATACVAADCYQAASGLVHRARRLEAPGNRSQALTDAAGDIPEVARQTRRRDRSDQMLAAGQATGRPGQAAHAGRPASTQPPSPGPAAVQPGIRTSAQPVEERRSEYPGRTRPAPTFSSPPDRSGPGLGSVLARVAGWALGIAVLGWIIAGAVSGSDEESDTDSTYVYPTATPVRVSSTRAVPVFQSFSRGDCLVFNSVSGVATRVSCTAPGAAKVLAVVELNGLTYPSQDTIDRTAEQRCPSATESYLYPTLEGWRRGDRDLLCLDR